MTTDESWRALTRMSFFWVIVIFKASFIGWVWRVCAIWEACWELHNVVHNYEQTMREEYTKKATITCGWYTSCGSLHVQPSKTIHRSRLIGDYTLCTCAVPSPKSTQLLSSTQQLWIFEYGPGRASGWLVGFVRYTACRLVGLTHRYLKALSPLFRCRLPVIPVIGFLAWGLVALWGH